MDKLREAARQALGALVRAEALYGQPNADIQTALREALAEQAEQEPVAWMWACTECGTEAEDGTDCRICSSCGYHKFYKAPKVATCVCAAKTQENVKQEPVAVVEPFYIRQLDDELELGAKLYLHPVRTKDPCHLWQDLTDEEISDAIHGKGSPLRLHDYAIRDFRAVIAAHKEKNK